MTRFLVRQRLAYFEDFAVEAASPEEAINLVNEGDAEVVSPPDYAETLNTYLLDERGGFGIKNQPENATPLE